MARPKANIDWLKVDRYLQAQCEGTGIAGLLGINPETLYRHCQEKHKMGFDAYSAIKKSEGKELLRGKQFEMAMKGNTAMVIWLGKQYLEQREKSDVSHEGIPAPININVTSPENAEKLKDFIDGKSD